MHNVATRYLLPAATIHNLHHIAGSRIPPYTSNLCTNVPAPKVKLLCANALNTAYVY